MTDKTKVISVRLPIEVAETYERKDGKTAREVLTEYAEGGVNTLKRETEKNPEEKMGVNTIKEMKELTSMTTYYGLTNEEFVRMVVRGLTDGYLTVEGGMVVGTPKMQLDEFIDACHERGLEPQETLDRTTVTLRRGK